MNFWKKIIPGVPLCPGCNEEIIFSIIPGICNECLDKLNLVQSFINHQPDFRSSFLEIISAPFYYKGIIKDLILNFKFKGRRNIASPLGLILSDFIQEGRLHLLNPLVIPIPLAKARMEIRGFNQADLLARVVSDNLKMDYSQTTLLRKRNTPALYQLNAVQRNNVLKGAFCINIKGSDLSNKEIILIDDIYTTGSTLEAAAETCINAGASSVYGFAVAAAQLQKNNLTNT
ncbi:MAG: ComF family protein [Bacillota bacterium]